MRGPKRAHELRAVLCRVHRKRFWDYEECVCEFCNGELFARRLVTFELWIKGRESGGAVAGGR